MDDVRSISATDLYARFASGRAPLVLDVRREAAFAADDRRIAGALRADPERLEAWAAALPEGGEIVAYCVHGHEVSQGAAAELRRRGVSAGYLAGGIAGWLEAGYPTASARAACRAVGDPPTRWVTRARPKIDRLACPWLIRRFLDPQAEILYVPAHDVLAVAARAAALPFDVPDVALSHQREACSFDAFLEHHAIADPALARLAPIVRGADTGRPDLAPQCAGLLAVSLGLCGNVPDDDELLDSAMPLYDALYCWAARLQDERHGWPPAA